MKQRPKPLPKPPPPKAPSPPNIWYFAYGSNLDLEQLKQRGIVFAESQPCRLDEYRFAFAKLSMDGTGKANLLPTPKGMVLGVAYRVNRETLEQLQGHEKGYDRKVVQLATRSGGTVMAELFIAPPYNGKAPLKPAPDYLERILRGAKTHGLPSHYINEIKSAALGPEAAPPVAVTTTPGSRPSGAGGR